MSIMHKGAVKVAYSLVKQTNSDDITRQKLQYVLERMFNIGLFILMFGLSLSILKLLNIDIVEPTLIFIITFLPIRLCFGGSHVKSDYMCIGLSTIIPIISGLLSTIVQFNLEFILPLYLIAAYIIDAIGVVDNPVKRLSDKKKAMYMKRGLVSFGVIFVIHMIMLYMRNDIMSNAMALGLIVGFGNLLLGE